jgi:hypothetical protein
VCQACSGDVLGLYPRCTTICPTTIEDCFNTNNQYASCDICAAYRPCKTVANFNVGTSAIAELKYPAAGYLFSMAQDRSIYQNIVNTTLAYQTNNIIISSTTLLLGANDKPTFDVSPNVKYVAYSFEDTTIREYSKITHIID